MNLSGGERKELCGALVDAFRTYDHLEMMVSFRLDQNLNEIAPRGELQNVAFKLIQWAERSGKLEDLIRGALQENSGNPKLQAFYKKYQEEIVPRERQSSTTQSNYEFASSRRIKRRKTVENENRRKFLKWAGFGGGGGLAIAFIASQILNSQSSTSDTTTSPVTQTTTSPTPQTTIPPIPENTTPPTPKLTPFEFKTVEVNEKGETVKESNEQAYSFKEGLGNDITLEMVKIPAGSFTMGSPADEKDRDEDEGPQRRVEVSEFFIGKYQVTQAQWKAVAALPKVNRDLKADPSRFKGDDRPIERVNWYDAVEFCARLSNHTDREYRLPSEAEWEYACRAATTTPFHFGETITSELANYDANYTYGAAPKGKYREETTPVGSFKVANAFGLYDMHGNVWEWCLDDWHDNYEGAPTDGSPWMTENDNLSQAKRRVLRGGSWFNHPNDCRSAYRINNYRSVGRDLIDSSFGFRVVCAFGRASS